MIPFCFHYSITMRDYQAQRLNSRSRGITDGITDFKSPDSSPGSRPRYIRPWTQVMVNLIPYNPGASSMPDGFRAPQHQRVERCLAVELFATLVASRSSKYIAPYWRSTLGIFHYIPMLGICTYMYRYIYTYIIGASIDTWIDR